ncbi:MAG TPA: class I SAM-dependent methyltransferase [Vicinamibacterales bacterium]|jgi:ubiquinone/menaquinone biosynthesis C-methylase UbiE
MADALVQPKPYRGLAMEGPIASWYARNTARDRRRFAAIARAVLAEVPPGGRILEVAPGPGYLSVELARAGRRVTAIDISESFVRMVRANAAQAGVDIEIRHGNASELPFPDAAFDFVVCVAAFKNFTEPLRALQEMYRVIGAGGQASIHDLRSDASPADIDAEVRGMGLSAWNAFLTRWTFRHMLLKRAYSRADLERMSAAVHADRSGILLNGIGYELRLRKDDRPRR